MNKLGRGVKPQVLSDIPPIIETVKVRRHMSMKKEFIRAGG
jgi:hypothetical protein